MTTHTGLAILLALSVALLAVILHAGAVTTVLAFLTSHLVGCMIHMHLARRSVKKVWP